MNQKSSTKVRKGVKLNNKKKLYRKMTIKTSPQNRNLGEAKMKTKIKTKAKTKTKTKTKTITKTKTKKAKTEK
jgi:hypothetical protein